MAVELLALLLGPAPDKRGSLNTNHTPLGRCNDRGGCRITAPDVTREATQAAGFLSHHKNYESQERRILFWSTFSPEG
jgi:hypothetical protein